MRKPNLVFWKDEDGFSIKDALTVAFGGLYLVEQLIVFVLTLLNQLPPEMVNVVQSLNGVVMTIIGGTFGVQTVREVGTIYNNRKTSQQPEETI